MASLMNRASRSVGFSKQQQSAPSTGRAQRLITRVKVETTPEAKTQTQQSNLEYLRSLPGITQPFPDVFDPFGLSTSTQTADLKRWRESEIVHGRVAMLAALGFLVGEQLEDFPAFVNFDGHITGPAIGHFQQVRQGFWEPLIIAIGVAESYRVAIGWATPEGQGFNRLKEDYEPGNLGFDPLNLKPSDPEEYKIMQTKELNNGRLAMIGIAGLVAQELVDHKEVFEHLFRNAENATGIELPSAPKGINLPNTPNLGIPKPDVPVPGPVGGKLGLPTPNLGGALQNNLDKLKVPSSLGGLRTGDVSINLPDLPDVKAAVNDIKPDGFHLPNPVQALKDNNPVEKLDLPTPNIGESLKNNIEKLKQPSDLAGLRPTDVSVKLPDVKPEDSTPTTGWKFPNPFGDLLRNTMPDVSNPDPNNAGNNDEFITKSPGDLIPQEYFQGPLRKDQNLEQTVS